jgi:endoglucanase
VIVAAAAAVLAAANGNGDRSQRPLSGTMDSLSGLRLYVDPNSPAAVQVAAWRGSGNSADAAALERIATQPTARWFANGDRPQATAAALVAAASAARAVAVLVLYNIPGRDCHSYSSGGASSDGDYLAWVSQIVAGIGHHPAIVLLEPDAIDQAAGGCLQQGQAAARYRLLSQAVATLKSNPSIHVYLDAGHSGWLSVGRVVGALRRAGVGRADGFALNVANFKTTSALIAYGRRIARRLGGTHFVIDTSRNGNGPPTNASGIDLWCNPAGRALGHAPTTRTGDPLVDAFLWAKYPGASDGACRPGEPPAGTWWPAYALELARGGGGG